MVAYLADGKIDYRCSKCGGVGCKLWRQSNTFLENIKLLCACCGEADQGKPLVLGPKSSYNIGGLIPAILTEDQNNFWGYTSASQDDVTKWCELPISPNSIFEYELSR